MATTTKTAREVFEQVVLRAPEFIGEDFVLSSEEQYKEVLGQIEEHKHLTNDQIPYEFSMRDAIYSWYENVYEPIMRAIDREGLKAIFQKHTRAELFLFLSRHWHFRWA